MRAPAKGKGAAALLLALVLGVTVAGCGTNDTGGALGATPSTGSPTASSSLTVEIKTATRTRQATIACNGEQGTGSGFLADPTVASLACKTVADPNATSRLVASTRSADCPTSVTVPSTAHVFGTLHGVAVDTTIDRANPCDAASWDLLTHLLGPP